MPIGCKTVEKRITSNDYKAQYFDHISLVEYILKTNKKTVNQSYAWI